MFGKIKTAQLKWQCIDEIEVPFSTQFEDVYFSKDNGLLETRHVFLNGNDLSERLSQLSDYQYFCIGETGFGTGLNILALWQLWRQVRSDNQSHLHVISVEKFPLTKQDLIRSLKAWQELSDLSELLIEQYPSPIAGCHRLHFPQERFSLDLWLGDAQDIFPIIPKTHVDAWFLDGFAPSCNPELWEEHVLNHIIRLSGAGTTFASFSVAGVLKRGLKAHGVEITRPRGFKHKKEMLKGVLPHHKNIPNAFLSQKIAIIGAGIAGLNTAWAFAQRGHEVHIFEKTQPLDGGSGNPLALLNPKLCPIEQSHEHLMTLSWQYAIAYYKQFKAFTSVEVEQVDTKKSDQFTTLINQYPVSELEACDINHYPRLLLKHGGVIRPHQLKDEIFDHPNIQLHQLELDMILENLTIAECQFDHIIVCAAKDSEKLFNFYPKLKPIRGQVSWCQNLKPLPRNKAFSYSGYCTQLDDNQLILGASFHPNREDTLTKQEDHLHNLELLEKVYPKYAAHLPDINTWQGRASIRAQTLDYFPLVGKIDHLYTMAGLGSKGFLFSPLCSEILAAQILNEAYPAPISLIEKLDPKRFIKKVKPKKPYYQSQ